MLYRSITERIEQFFKKEKNKEYILNIRSDIGLDGQKIKAETISLLTLLQINYLCDSEEERKEILKELQENDRLKEEESREKYNPDNIFKNRNNKLEKEENVAMVEYKEPSFIRRILDRIKILFKR